MKIETWRTINGLKHLVMSAKEWQETPAEYKGAVTDCSRLHTEFGWPVGTKTALHYDDKRGTCLVPVVIDG